MTPASRAAKAAARALIEAVGGRPRIHRYYDEDESTGVDVASFDDRPVPGYSTYSTLTLHESPNLLDDKDVRVELIGVASRDVDSFPNVLATAAFLVMKQRWLCAPGVVFPDLLTRYAYASAIDHLLFVPPFDWEQLGAVALSDDLTVHWLLAMPIFEAERRVLHEHGYDEFVERLECQQVEYADLAREPAV